MERKQLLVQRSCDFFADRFYDVVRMIRQDRQQMGGWEEPEHVRAVFRRILHEGTSAETGAREVTVAEEAEFGRGVNEPPPGQQRDALCQLLAKGAAALEKVAGNQAPELTADELNGLECILLLYGRPALPIRQKRLVSVTPFWNILDDHREGIEMAARGVGRIELLGHPEYDWAGTGFLVGDTALMTTRRTAETFTEFNRTTNQWQFRPGVTAWLDYRSLYRPGTMAGYRLRRVLGVHDKYDLAILEVEPPHRTADAPIPLTLAAQAPAKLEGRPVYLVGYPVRDPRRNEPEFVARIFRDVYNVKRVQPGLLRGGTPAGDLHRLQHDCAMLGCSGGSCLIDLETHQVLGLHVAGRYLEPGSAIPLWVLRDDPLLKQHGVRFADAADQDAKAVLSKVERLAASRYWADARAAISSLFQRAFGEEGAERGS
jgi:hypothetical protein